MTFTKEEILEALGIEEKSSWLPMALCGFGVGCLVGAAAALLLAPKSGRALREDLIARGRDLGTKAREFVGRGSETTQPTH